MKEIQLVQLTTDEFKSILSGVVSDVLDNSSSPEETVLLTGKEVLSRLNITQPTLHKYKNECLFPHYKLGGRVYYKWDEVLLALKQV